MKKYLVLFLVLIVALSLCACDKDPQQNPGVSDPTGNSSETSDPTNNSSVPAHTHEYTQEVVAPTCTVNGYTLNTCECGDNYTSDEVAAPGHAWSPATCTTPKTCTVCEATEGHLADHNYKDGKCTACESPDPDYKSLKSGKWVCTKFDQIMDREHLLVQTLCFDPNSTEIEFEDGVQGWWKMRAYEYIGEPEPEFMEDQLAAGMLIQYNGEYYLGNMGELGGASITEKNGKITVEMLGWDSSIVLQRTAGNKLKVTAINGDATVGLGSLTVGEIFTWEE